MAYKIIKDFAGSPNGSHVINYRAGETVDLTPSLAAVAVKEGWAKEVKARQKADSDAEAAARAAAEAEAAKTAAIADLEAKIAVAAAADKPALEAELAKLKSE